MAKGYSQYFAKDKAEITSTAIETHGINSRAIETIDEDGTGNSHHFSKSLDQYRHIIFDFVITIGGNAKQRGPLFPAAAKKFHQNSSGPLQTTGTREAIQNQFKKVRRQIKDYYKVMVADNLQATCIYNFFCKSKRQCHSCTAEAVNNINALVSF